MKNKGNETILEKKKKLAREEFSEEVPLRLKDKKKPTTVKRKDNNILGRVQLVWCPWECRRAQHV